MKNHVDWSVGGCDDLDRLKAAVADPAEIDRLAAQAEDCLAWYDVRNDPDTTTNCGPVDLRTGQLRVPHHTARSVRVPPLRFYFTIDDRHHPYIITIVRVRWVLRVGRP
ncbi:MAG: hypothetical protein K2X82_19990 [Gemmataceae bacterium]|nr:hypothetical protein [Gemmataceae bacterium]